MSLQKTVWVASCILALGSAWGGSGAERGVRIDGKGRRASGWRASLDSLEPIGCRVVSALGMQAAQCFAQDAVGKTAQCTTLDADLIAAADETMRFVSFAWNERGDCVSIERNPGSSRRARARMR